MSRTFSSVGFSYSSNGFDPNEITISVDTSFMLQELQNYYSEHCLVQWTKPRTLRVQHTEKKEKNKQKSRLNTYILSLAEELWQWWKRGSEAANDPSILEKRSQPLNKNLCLYPEEKNDSKNNLWTVIRHNVQKLPPISEQVSEIKFYLYLIGMLWDCLDAAHTMYNAQRAKIKRLMVIHSSRAWMKPNG